MADWKHEFINTNGIRIHYVTEGKGPLVVLLHGFPQFWYAWRKQIPALAEHFKVVARICVATAKPIGPKKFPIMI